MKLIVGLGNPGKEYERTRHNAGFLVVDELARRMELRFAERRGLQALSAQGRGLRLLKPSTFMNLSGDAVRAAMKKDALKPEDVLMVYDDADLPLGEVRAKEGGGSAGHNGVKSIKEALPKDAAVARVRVGIGRSENAQVPLDAWVLGTWTKEEAQMLPEIVAKAADAAEAWLQRKP